jgi:hypothetical protein
MFMNLMNSVFLKQWCNLNVFVDTFYTVGIICFDQYLTLDNDDRLFFCRIVVFNGSVNSLYLETGKQS